MPRSLRRGEIYLLKADSVGKERPVLIVSPVSLNGGNTILAIPFYSKNLENKMRLGTGVQFQSGEFGLQYDCVSKADEVTLWNVNDLQISRGPIGTLSFDRLVLIDNTLRVALGLP